MKKEFKPRETEYRPIQTARENQNIFYPRVFGQNARESFTDYSNPRENVARAYPGDDIRKHLENLNAIGGGTVILAPGTHNVDYDIQMYPSTRLLGATRGSTIIDFGGNSNQIKITGTLVDNTGSVNTTDGSTTITGSGTTNFTSAMIGNTIFVNDLFYVITDVTNTATLTIESPYSGTSLTNAEYSITDPIYSAILDKLTIQNSATAAIKTDYCTEVYVLDTNIYDSGTGIDGDIGFGVVVKDQTIFGCGTGINFYKMYSWTINNTFIGDCSTSSGIIFLNSGNAELSNTQVDNSVGNGVSMSSCYAIGVVNMSLTRNSAHGIEMVETTDTELAVGFYDTNGISGIRLTGDDDRTVITSLTTSNNGSYGIDIAATSCDNTILIGVQARGNGITSVNDSGSNTLKSATVNNIP